uniref:Uncharacterized protein n=1 Tax=Terrapene triunguis TaxID=2587831 RepID=A0A674J3P8_9SAUR
MTDGLMSKAATMEIPINGTGDTGSLPEDDGLEQDLQQVMVSGPNLNETSIVSGGYGGTAEGIIPTSSVKGKEPWGGELGVPGTGASAGALPAAVCQAKGAAGQEWAPRGSRGQRCKGGGSFAVGQELCGGALEPLLCNAPGGTAPHCRGGALASAALLPVSLPG